MANWQRKSTIANNYGHNTGRPYRTHRLAILVAHWLHWISSIIVMSIAAYFISHYTHNTHLVYWVTIAAIDALLYLPALVLPFAKSYKGYLAPLAWLFSYLWLTAFIFSAQDYNFYHDNSGNCNVSPIGVNKCRLKKTLESFAFIAFFTSLVSQALEGWLWARWPVKQRVPYSGKSLGNSGAGGATPVGNGPGHDNATGISEV